MKKTFAILVLLFSGFNAHAMSIEMLYGNNDKAFISEYNKRLLKSFLDFNLDFKKCISPELQTRIENEIFPNYESWGKSFQKGLAMLPYFEVFYRSVSSDSLLEKGIRVRVPKAQAFKFSKISLGASNEDYGFEIYINKDSQCVSHSIKETEKALVFGDGRVLPLRLKSFPAVKRLPFFEFTRAELSGKDSEESVTFLRSFNLLFLNSKVYPHLNYHQKEFRQMVLRLNWKSTDEFTVYFPQ